MTDESTPVTRPFLGADVDNGSVLNFVIVTQPDEGTVTVDSNGNYTFDPAGDFDDLSLGTSRQVTFDYRAIDNVGAESAPATVTVTVAGQGDGITVQLHPLNPFEPKLDGQWQGSYFASDGKVYFGSSTHAHDAAGLFFQYDPASGVVTQVGQDLSAIVGEDATTNVPQGKLHSPIVESGGWLFTSAYLGNYWEEAQNAYTGSHLFGYQLGSLEAGQPNFVDFGIAIAGYANYSAVAVSPDGQYLWTVVTPWAEDDAAISGAHLYRTDIATGSMQDFGQLTPDINAVQGGFAIHVDNRGDAWVTLIGGADRLFVGRAATGTIDVFPGALPLMTHQYNAGELSAYQDASWWHDGDSRLMANASCSPCTTLAPRRLIGRAVPFGNLTLPDHSTGISATHSARSPGSAAAISA